MRDLVPRLRVMARSSPTDKNLLVKHLRANGEVVAATGDGELV
jgi:Ca2+-transporting ATPase